MRLKIPDGGVERFHLLRRDVGWVGNDQVIRPQKLLCRLQRIHGHTVDAAGQLELGNIPPRHAQRRCGNVAQRHARVLHTPRDRQTDAAGAGAQIQDPRVLLQIHRLLDGQRRHHNGVVARDEHVRRHRQRHTVEVPLTQNIGHWLPAQPPLDEGFRELTDLLGGIDLPVRDDLLRRFAGRGAHQLPRNIGSELPLLLQQRAARVEKQVGVFLYHRSSPSFSGRTSVSASMPTSIMESSGSLVVRYCSHIPGAESACVSQLS